MARIIGFTGKMYSGKSTAAQILKEWIPNGVRLSFASDLKDLAKELGWNGEKDKKGRRLLQLLGTDVCRQCLGEDYWITKFQNKISRPIYADKVIIVDDVRFDNEAQMIKDLGGILIRIKRRNFGHWLAGLFKWHKSERKISEKYITLELSCRDGKVAEELQKIKKTLETLVC